MAKMVIKWILFAFALILISKILPGIKVENFQTAMIAVVAIGIVNTFISPVIKILSLPINLVTLGLFTLVINAALFALSAYFVPGFYVEGFIPAFLGSVLFSFFSVIINFSAKLLPV